MPYTSTPTSTEKMQTATELSSPSSSLKAVGSPLSWRDQFQQALSVASRYRSRNGTKSLQAITTNYIVISLCILISEYAYSSSSQYLSTSKHIIYAFACLVIASRLRAFENRVHEASHLNLFTFPSTHYSFQFLYSFPVFRMLEDYRASHLQHHQRLGDPTQGPRSHPHPRTRPRQGPRKPHILPLHTALIRLHPLRIPNDHLHGVLHLPLRLPSQNPLLGHSTRHHQPHQYNRLPRLLFCSLILPYLARHTFLGRSR